MMKRTRLGPARRRGFSFLELQVAFLLLAIALAGLGPLVVMQSKQLRNLESRFNAQDTYYFAPASDTWARKLGAAAKIQLDDPGTPTTPVTLIDDGDSGYSERDLGIVDWYNQFKPGAFDGSHRRNNGSVQGDTAIWEFSGIAPGWYEVWVTYAGHEDCATNAPYTVFDGTTVEATVRVNQSEVPSGAYFRGCRWESLGLYSMGGNLLRVELSDDADGDIFADAVRIVPVRNQVALLSTQKTLENATAVAHVSITLMVP